MDEKWECFVGFSGLKESRSLGRGFGFFKKRQRFVVVFWLLGVEHTKAGGNRLAGTKQESAGKKSDDAGSWAFIAAWVGGKNKVSGGVTAS